MSVLLVNVSIDHKYITTSLTCVSMVLDVILENKRKMIYIDTKYKKNVIDFYKYNK